MEILPRLVKIENVSLSSDQASTNASINSTVGQVMLSATITLNAYYGKPVAKIN
jgi:hypothetical protein